MDERSRPLSDDTLDREVAAALDVEPSPEFLARVRLRVASEPPPSAWRARWMPLAAGTAIVVIAVAATVSEWPTIEPSGPRRAADPSSVVNPSIGARPGTRAAKAANDSAGPRPAVRPAGEMEDPAGPLRGTRPTRAETLPAGSRAVRADPEADPPPFPEVLIPEAERRGFELLLTGIGMGTLDGVLPPDEPIDLSTPPLEIEALVIEPLPPLARLE